uniref:RRM domain-containing protein n=1 Tax=Brassica oleracea TaxID=3712 RepID=A0A3P6EGK0_BRAOL|nr:unnamed protein product [Brassica oleracea]
MESEFVALAASGKEAEWLRNLVYEIPLWPKPVSPISIHCDKEDETPPNFVENVLFVSNLSPQTKLFHIIDYFSYVGEVVSVRLIVNPEGKHVGYGFAETNEW